MDSEVRYYINKDKRTVVCKIIGCCDIALRRLDKFAPHFDYYYRYIGEYDIPDEFYGTAKCAPEDEWDEEYGKKLALTRAKQKRGKAVNAMLNRCLRIMAEEMDNIRNMAIHKIPDEEI